MPALGPDTFCASSGPPEARETGHKNDYRASENDGTCREKERTGMRTFDFDRPYPDAARVLELPIVPKLARL